MKIGSTNQINVKAEHLFQTQVTLLPAATFSYILFLIGFLSV